MATLRVAPIPGHLAEELPTAAACRRSRRCPERQGTQHRQCGGGCILRWSTSGCGARAGELRDYVRAARELGFNTVSANDHLLWRRPWLDRLTALSAVVEHAAGMTMATSVALPAVRHPVVLAKSLAILAVLHAGPFIAGIGRRSGRADSAAVGVPFPERWTRFDEAARDLASGVAGRVRPPEVVEHRFRSK
jgi:alkanesulfonate monooxygenase SsuD/methylene tetrahydromethanopterin reductase-like flavin-dependent oxidoreductase (luciferase family)